MDPIRGSAIVKGMISSSAGVCSFPHHRTGVVAERGIEVAEDRK